MGIIESYLEERLTFTFTNFIRHGLHHALKATPKANDILQLIINIQGALELLSKLYVLKKGDWKDIVRKDLHNKKEEEIVRLISTGKIKTVFYEQEPIPVIH